MNNPTSKSIHSESNHTNDVILIGDPQPQHQYDFESLHELRSAPQQQQQVINIYEERVSKNYLLASDNLNYPSITIPQSQLKKQFQQIRFGETENLMDMDLLQDEKQKSILELTPYEYENFIYNRQIQIQTPLLINQGYIMSYKLYQIKTRVVERSEQLVGKGKGGMKSTEKLQRFSGDYHVPQEKIFLFSKNATNKLLQTKSSAKKQDQSQDKHYDTCVSRRFSDFQYLNELLIAKYGGYIIPLLPQKNFWTIINLQGKQYAQTRTKSLVKYLTRLFTHKTLKHSQQLKHFLFQQDSKFSTQKGQYLQKNKRIQDKIISISSGALEYGKALYSRFLGGAQKSKNQEEIRLSKSKLSKEDLIFSQYEIVVGELMRIVGDVKGLVEITIQEMETVEDVGVVFSSGLTDSFNIPTSAPISNISSPKLQNSIITQSISPQQLSQQFQQISQFITSCHAAIQRRKSLRQQIQQLKQQQQFLQQKYKNSPRSLQLDLLRSKLSKLNKMNQTYAEELIKELEFHVDEGKGMLRLFVVKFQNKRNQFFSCGGGAK